MKNVSERLEYLSCMKDLNEMQLIEVVTNKKYLMDVYIRVLIHIKWEEELAEKLDHAMVMPLPHRPSSAIIRRGAIETMLKSCVTGGKAVDDNIKKC